MKFKYFFFLFFLFSTPALAGGGGGPGNMIAIGSWAPGDCPESLGSIVFQSAGPCLTASSVVSNFSAGTTGLTPASPTTGAVVLGGVLNIANGGTGQATANAAFNALAPSQTSNSGKFLSTDGTNTSWATVGGSVNLGTSASATNPSRNGDATTGLFSPATTTVAIATGGVEALRVDASQRIGIGTTTPSSPLTLVGSGGTSTGPAVFDVTATASGSYVWGSAVMAPNLTAGQEVISPFVGQAKSVNNSGYMGFKYNSAGSATNALTWGFYGNAADQMTLTNGNLYVAAPSSGSQPVMTLQVPNAVGNNAQLNFAVINAGSNINVAQVSSIYTAANHVGLSFSDFNSGLSEVMRLVDGKLGIGTTTPVVSLDLSQKNDALALPVGTQGQEPSSPINGMIRYSTTANDLEAYIANAWTTLTTGGDSAIIYLGTSASATNPSRNGDVTTGLYSATTSTVSVSAAGTNIVTIGTNGMNIANGTLTGASATSNFLNVTGTLPSTVTAGQAIGTSFQITSAGSSSFIQRAMYVQLLSGYTGSSFSAALQFSNSAAGTGTGAWTSGNYNAGIAGSALGSTLTGHNVGGNFAAVGSSILNIGILGKAVGSVGTPALNVASAGLALNATTNVGGFFGLMSTAPTLGTSAALIADNGATSSPIFIAQNNGTAQVTIGSTGTTIGSPTGSFEGSGTLNATGLYVNGVAVLTSAPVTSVSNADSTLTISPTTGAVVASLNLANANTWTGTQTFNTNPPIFGTMTQGSVLFAGTSGTLTQNNANFFWDNSNIRLGIGTSTPTNDLSFSGQANREIWMERETTSSTAGNNLTIQSGGAVSGGTSLSGGNLILSGGTSTGTATSSVIVQVPIGNNFASTTSDNAPQTVLTIGGSTGFNYTPPTLTSTSISGGLGGPSVIIKSGSGQSTTFVGSIIPANNNAGNIQIISGAGGSSSNGTPNNAAGAGGGLSIVSGTGGLANSSGSVTNRGGNGGNANVSTGDGGSAGGGSGATNLAGAGGSFAFTGGTGGQALSGATNTGGAGGAVSVIGGQGGVANSGNSGAGGSATITGGRGGFNSTTGTAGNGGNIVIQSGPAGAGSGGASSGSNGTISLQINTTTKAFINASGLISLGSGTTALSTVDIFGSTAIGSYAGANAAPTNGLIVSGSVGIGTSSPLASLDVNGAYASQGTVGVSCAAGAVNILTIVVTNGIVTHC